MKITFSASFNTRGVFKVGDLLEYEEWCNQHASGSKLALTFIWFQFRAVLTYPRLAEEEGGPGGC